MWAPTIAAAKAVDRNEKFVSPWFVTGLFERLHMMMGKEATLVNFYAEPEAMHELIEFLADWEIDAAREEIRRYQPDAIYHHDDWGSQTRLMLSPAIFEEFFLEPYKRSTVSGKRTARRSSSTTPIPTPPSSCPS